jgi:hypothetical protein
MIVTDVGVEARVLYAVQQPFKESLTTEKTMNNLLCRRAFGKKYLMPELDWRSHLAAHDQVGVGFEDGIDLLIIGHLFSVEYAARLSFASSAAGGSAVSPGPGRTIARGAR